MGVELPDGCGAREMEDYVRDAVRCMKGALDPEEPLFDLDRDSVTVKPKPKAKPAGKRVTVKRGCPGCSFRSTEHKPWPVCTLDPELQGTRSGPRPPAWCKLRTGPVMVSLVTT